MTTKTTTRKSTPPRPGFATRKNTETNPIALTVKLDAKTYVRLRTLGATQRRTNQDIMREAVERFLDRAGA